MRARRGQIALYLIAVLVAICVLCIMNVGIYLSVTAKNRAMNAGDAAALAVANYQGVLLNRIGQLNIDHLKAALDNDEDACDRIAILQLRTCFLGPISGEDGGDARYRYGAITAGNEAARNNGAEGEMSSECHSVEKFLMRHAQEIRTYYVGNPEVYPEPWEGAWNEYALKLDQAAGEGILAGPDNINFIDAASGHYLLDPQFYNAIAGRCWCWFKFNAPGLLDSYADIHSWDPLPSADDVTRWHRRVNSEVYSLNLRRRVGSAVDLLGTNLICRLTGATETEIAKSYMITNVTQAWFFYDEDVWRTWWEIDPYGRWNFPVVGQVRPEYDVRGCAAICRVFKTVPDLVSDVASNFEEGDVSEGEGSSALLGTSGGVEHSIAWAAAAKPFGTVENEDGDMDVVTSYRGFVAPSCSDDGPQRPAFERACLVPIDCVGGKDLSTADADFMLHVRDHLPSYLQTGLSSVRLNGCSYCQQLLGWERASFRKTGSIWLKFNGGSCVRPLPGTCSSGGTPHGH